VSVALAPERFSTPGLAPTGVDFRLNTRRAAEPGLRGPLLAQFALLATIAVLALPAATPLASASRYLFPAAAVLVAGWLYLRGFAASFLSFCLWLFALTPFVRRLADGHAGFLQANTLMLAPYLAAAWAALSLPRFLLARGRTGQWPIGLILFACVYAFMGSIVHESLMPGAVDLLRWITPPLLACYIMTHARRWPDFCAALRALALVALPALSLYAIYQYVALPLWDAIWMMNSKMDSIGPPQRFQVRVFGTLNSPASLAYYLDALILVSLCLKTPVRWLNACLGAAALALTLVRSAWLGLAAGLFILLVRAPHRARMSVMALAAGLVLAAPLAITNARVEHMVSQRIETLTNLNGDVSMNARSDSYAAAADELVDKPWGEGLGTANVASNFTAQKRVIDGGPIEVMVALGLLFGVIYLAMIAVLGGVAFLRSPPRSGQDIWAAAQAILLTQGLAFVSVTTTIGEIGVLFWLAIGLLLAAPRPEPTRHWAPVAR
jgi:hypothetical protein